MDEQRAIHADLLSRWHNLNFLRNISFGERARLRIGAECFNIFNHANFSAVGTVFGSATFGNLTASLDPRQIQLSAKLVF